MKFDKKMKDKIDKYFDNLSEEELVRKLDSIRGVFCNFGYSPIAGEFFRGVGIEPFNSIKEYIGLYTKDFDECIYDADDTDCGTIQKDGSYSFEDSCSVQGLSVFYEGFFINKETYAILEDVMKEVIPEEIKILIKK